MFGVNPSMDGREIGHVASSEHQTSPVYFPPRLLKPGLWGCIGPLVYWQKKRNVLPPKRAHSLETVRQQVVCQRHRTAGVGGACLLGCGRGPQLPPFCAFFDKPPKIAWRGVRLLERSFSPRHVTWAGRSFRELPRARALQGYLGRDGYAFVHCGVIISAEDVHR